MNQIVFAPGVQINSQLFTFKDGKSTAELEICKKETITCTYKLAIIYLGQNKENKAEWKIRINSQTPINPAQKMKLKYIGSSKFEVCPASEIETSHNKKLKAVHVLETNADQINELKIDLSGLRYMASIPSNRLRHVIISR